MLVDLNTNTVMSKIQSVPLALHATLSLSFSGTHLKKSPEKIFCNHQKASILWLKVLPLVGSSFQSPPKSELYVVFSRGRITAARGHISDTLVSGFVPKRVQQHCPRTEISAHYCTVVMEKLILDFVLRAWNSSRCVPDFYSGLMQH